MSDPVAGPPLRIALADDQALVRDGLAALLGRLGMRVAAQAEDGADLLAQLAATPVDVIVSDIRMPGLDGIALVRELRARAIPTPVVLLTTFEDDDLPLAAAAAGAMLSATRPSRRGRSASARSRSCGCSRAGIRTRRSRARCTSRRAP